jgi:hypothetical protein
MNTANLKAFIRANGYAWPGGYPMALLMCDGECIDAQSARENYRLIRQAMKNPGTADDWEPMGVFIHWEGEPIQCAHSGRMIESAYGVTDEVQSC